MIKIQLEDQETATKALVQLSQIFFNLFMIDNLTIANNLIPIDTVIFSVEKKSVSSI